MLEECIREIMAKGLLLNRSTSRVKGCQSKRLRFERCLN